MATFSWSTSLPSCSSSFERTHSEPYEVRDVGCYIQAVDRAPITLLSRL